MLRYHSGQEVECVVGNDTFIKDLALPWAAGSAGGLDTGSLATTASYHTHVIAPVGGGQFDVLFSCAPLNPAVPTGWEVTGDVLGAVLTDGTGRIVPFRQTGQEFYLTDGFYDLSDAPSTGDVLRTVSVPMGVKVQYIALSSWKGSGASFISASDPDLGAPAGAPWAFIGYRPPGISPMAYEIRVWTNCSAQIYTKDANNAALLTLVRKGWLDPRVSAHAG
jgi:hypothetical protein